jgi:hypothetical protein
MFAGFSNTEQKSFTNVEGCKLNTNKQIVIIFRKKCMCVCVCMCIRHNKLNL